MIFDAAVSVYSDEREEVAVQTRNAVPGGTGEPAAAMASVPLALSLPKASFTSESEFRREREAVLFASWFCVGRAETLAAAGDYLTADVAGESVIVVRGDEGDLHGFYNLCRHRGSRLVAPEDGEPAAVTEAQAAVPGRTGCFAGAIRCPYHAWTYGLDGTLRSAPFLPDLRSYRAALSLHPVDVDCWGGFVFVRLEPGAGPSLAETLGEIPDRVAAYQLAGLRSRREAELRGCRELEGLARELQRVLPLRSRPPGAVRACALVRARRR